MTGKPLQLSPSVQGAYSQQFIYFVTKEWAQ
jgi:hypothetical protein